MSDILPVRSFERSIEPSFPENDALPKKNLSDEKFDQKFSEFYLDLKDNLDRVQDQLTKIFKTDIEDNINIQGQETSLAISNLDGNLAAAILEVNQTIEATNQILQSVQDNLYSE